MTKLTMEEKQQLIRMALAAREKAYAPYSDFMVGAALRAADGRIFTGCNVENAAFTPHQLRRAHRPVQGGGGRRDRVYGYCGGGQPPGRSEPADHLALRGVPSGTIRVWRAGAERHYGKDPGGFH